MYLHLVPRGKQLIDTHRRHLKMQLRWCPKLQGQFNLQLLCLKLDIFMGWSLLQCIKILLLLQLCLLGRTILRRQPTHHTATAIGYNCCDSSSNDSTPRTWSTFAGNNQVNQNTPMRVMPDFAQVYSFIGSVFDPSESDHIQKLKQMVRSMWKWSWC